MNVVKESRSTRWQTFDLDEVLDMMRITQKLKRWNNAQLAKSLGVSPQYLSDVYLRRRAPGPKLLEGLGLVAEIVYKERSNARS